MTAFSIWTLIAGAYLVLAGLLILVAVFRHRKARVRHRPARRPVRADAFATGRVSLPRAAGVGRPARGWPVVAARRAGEAATTALLPSTPAAHTPVGGGYPAGRASAPRGLAGLSSRLDGAVMVAPRRAWVSAPGRGRGAGTPQAVPGSAFERGALPGTLSTSGRAMPRAHDGAHQAGHEHGRIYASSAWTRAAASTTAR